MIDPASFGSPSDKRLAVRLTPAGEREVKRGHPWVFDGSVASVSHDGASGDLAVIFDKNRKFVAIGLYDPRSPIRVRILHRGSPTTIDRSFWEMRIDDALALREPLADGETDGYRCIHGENDGLGGLVVDRYGDALVIKVYSQAWFVHLAGIVELLVERFAPSSIVLRLGRLVAKRAPAGVSDGCVIFGSPPAGPVAFREHGLEFFADIIRGQKTGHFLDQRDNRHRVGQAAAGASVLDVFSCTGGFSVHAAAGGAASVHSVDQSTHALANAERNMAANQDRPEVAAARHSITAGDAFAVMADLGGAGVRHDIVVVDPPSFAGREKDVDSAMVAYRRLTRLALDVVEPGGLLVQASCSSRIGSDEFVDAVLDECEAAGVRLSEVRVTGHGVDHPITFTEGPYLKAIFATIT